MVLELLELFDVVQLHLAYFALLLLRDLDLLVLLTLSVGADHYHALVTGPAQKSAKKKVSWRGKKKIENTITRATFEVQKALGSCHHL